MAMAALAALVHWASRSMGLERAAGGRVAGLAGVVRLLQAGDIELDQPGMASATHFARAWSGSFIIPASTAGKATASSALSAYQRWGITSDMMPPSFEWL